VAYHNAYCLYDPQNASRFSDDLFLHTLELPKVEEEDDHTELWAWLEFLKAQSKEELEMLGEAQGEARGAAQTQQAIARKLLESGMSVEEIVRFTGLSWEAVLAMKV
jgi:hypothetical protein